MNVSRNRGTRKHEKDSYKTGRNLLFLMNRILAGDFCLYILDRDAVTFHSTFIDKLLNTHLQDSIRIRTHFDAANITVNLPFAGLPASDYRLDTGS